MNATESTEATITTVKFSDLPAIGADFAGGEFAGIHTKPDGTHWAVSRLPGFGSKLTHKLAIADAQARGGELPTKAVAALVVANLKIEEGWYWTCDVYDASSAWFFDSYGDTFNVSRSAAGGALAVRLIQIAD
jgi:hypothetical protein